MFSSLTSLRKATKDMTTEEVAKVIEHLQKIVLSKQEKDKKYFAEMEQKEKARLEAISHLEEHKIPVPADLRNPITIDDVKPKRRRKKVVENAEEAE